MGMQIGQIRILSLAVVKKDGKILVCPGHDKVKNEDFFRLIGGGVHFGENSLAALKREIKEELNIELINYKLISVLENIFTYNGKNGHEISFIYETAFKDASNYERQSFPILDSSEGLTAIWVEMNKKNIEKIYPKNCATIQ